MPQPILDFICGLLTPAVMFAALFGLMRLFGSFTGSPFDHPLWIAGMFSWLPILFIIMGFAK